ncbi:hypothetical protein ONZ45_g19665 [Pleurotus djamor]|nr:hypothetical protein ONZ45_g19665 [Pleurotus djamor]
MRIKILKNRIQSIEQFEKTFAANIHDYNFKPGALVLVRNSKLENDLSGKMKARYAGPMVVVRRTQGGAYVLSELDGAVSALRFGAFRVVPYYARSTYPLPTPLLDPANLLPDEAVSDSFIQAVQ